MQDYMAGGGKVMYVCWPEISIKSGHRCSGLAILMPILVLLLIDPCLHCYTQVIQKACVKWRQISGASCLCLASKWQHPQTSSHFHSHSINKMSNYQEQWASLITSTATRRKFLVRLWTYLLLDELWTVDYYILVLW